MSARAADGMPRRAPMRVLVVDDDEVDRMTVRRALTRAGMEVSLHEADRAASALAALRAESFDAVFLDYNMPGSDGLLFLRAIRDSGQGVPVIMLTGQGDEQVAVALMKAGAIDYLPKSALTPERLAQSLRYAVDLTRAAAMARRAEEELRLAASRARYLAEAGSVLAGSLGVQATLASVARLAVPRLADRALAWVADDAGQPAEGVDADAAASRGLDAGAARDAVARLDASGAVVVALRARGRLLGGLALMRATASAAPDPDEVALAEELAARAALALDNARLYEEAERSRALAETANRAKSEFLARMSHDLRTPLNAIGGYSQLIEMGVHGPVTEEQLRAIARIRRAQEHLLTLINDILSFAKLEAGQVGFAVRDVALEDALASAATLVEPMAREKQIAFDYRAAPPAVQLRADPERLQQILTNLLGNAVKFTAAGGRVCLDWSDATPGAVEILVRDTGQGIARDRQESIFEPFVQVHRTPAGAEEGGVGLGLAISRELTRAMGGTLTVESALGEGSTFVVRLPAVAVDSNA